MRVIWNLDWLTQRDSKHSTVSIDSSNKAEMKDECPSSHLVYKWHARCQHKRKQTTRESEGAKCPLTPPVLPSLATRRLVPSQFFSGPVFSMSLSFLAFARKYLHLFSHPYLKICHLSPSEVALPTHCWAAAFRFGWQPASVFWDWNTA